MTQHEQITSANEAMNSQLIADFMHVKDQIEEYMPGFFNMDNLQVTLKNDSIQSVLTMKKQHLIEDFLQLLSSRKHVNIFFIDESPDRQNCEAVAYSIPYTSDMFIACLSSRQHGIIDEMELIIFNSLDNMFRRLKLINENRRAPEERNTIIEQSKTDFYTQFM